MLTVTDAATAQLNEMLANSPDGAAVRLVSNGSMLEPRVDQQREGDTEYKHGDKTVLLVEPGIAEFLSNHVLDAKTTVQGNQLMLNQAAPESQAAE